MYTLGLARSPKMYTLARGTSPCIFSMGERPQTILLETPFSHRRPLCLSNTISNEIRYNYVLGFVLSKTLNENSASIQHHEENFKNWTLFGQNSSFNGAIFTSRFYRENYGKLSKFFCLLPLKTMKWPCNPQNICYQLMNFLCMRPFSKQTLQKQQCKTLVQGAWKYSEIQ